jgi:hypothetical protein
MRDSAIAVVRTAGAKRWACASAVAPVTEMAPATLRCAKMGAATLTPLGPNACHHG